MKPKKYKVMIDIYKGVLNNQLIEFTTQDHGSNVLEFEILEDKVTPYNLDGCLVRMVINGQQQDCTIADATNGLVNITLHQSMFSEVGPVFAELQIYDALNQTIRLTTPIFKYTVKKSLMDDETVQADPNYSILQNMILEVSSADEVAKQAKKTAESAMATANQAESKANQIMSNGDYAKEQGDYAKAEGDRLQGMLTLGGAPQTKFDFIKDKVAPDGLIKAINNTPISKQLLEGCKSFIVRVSTANKIVADTLILNQGLLFGSLVNQVGLRDYPGSYSCVTDCSQTSDVIYYCEVTENRVLVINLRDNTKKERINSEGKKIEYVESTKNDYKLNAFFYNRPLTLQEIQYMFSVLNNSPSIKELHTTDSTGKTSILKLASDTDHVEDRSGRTQEQINRTFYKRMCKEIPSPSGEPITVKNGEEGYVLSAEIKGNTQLFKRAKGSQDEWIVIPNDEGRDTVAFEYKLDSTQAIISNNGEKYPIYATEEDKANKKVILIGGVGDVYDTLELKEDGSVIYTQNTKNLVLNGSENWKLDNDGIKNLDTTAIFGNLPGSTDKVRVIGDMYKGDTWNNGWVNDNIVFMHPNGGLFIRDTSIATLEEFKAKLSTTNLIVRGSLGTPIVTHIPKELVPAILTHNQTNILGVGGAVKPSSFKVTVPVDRLAEIEARLQALESTTVDVVLNK